MDAISDLVNYVVFFLTNLVLDVILLVKMRETLAEKRKKFKIQSDERSKKKMDEFEEVINRVVKMIIINALFNMLCKIPLSIVSVNDLRLLVKTRFEMFQVGYGREMFEFPYSMKVFCHIDEVCLVFLAFGNFLFHLSSAVNIFFYNSFDRKFKQALENTLRLDKSTSTIQNLVQTNIA